VKAAIDQLAGDRANIGANISRLSSTGEQLGVLTDNLTAAVSRIQDVDVAEESTSFAKFNILVQAGTAMLAQANATPQSVLKLLQ
jgi:flagellin